jgi:hypothetical protein
MRKKVRSIFGKMLVREWPKRGLKGKARLEFAVRLDPSPIPKGKPTPYPNRAYLSPMPLFLSPGTCCSLGAEPTCPGVPWIDLRSRGPFVELFFDPRAFLTPH